MSALLLPNEILSMSAQAARALTARGDGDCALLYLALLDCGELRRAAAALHWDRPRLDAAYGALVSMGLARAEENTPPAPPQEEPPKRSYERADVLSALEQEPDFRSLYLEVERQLGRKLSDADLTALYSLYDGLALPPEVIVQLVGHVIQTVRRQKGSPAAMPRIAQIQREGYRWKRLGLDSLELAEEYLHRQQAVDCREWEILSIVGVTQRRPAVEKEREFIAAWVEMGFSDELIRLAWERTVYRKGQMNWPYMNKILLAWKQSGWTTPEQVLAGEKPPKRAAQAQPGPRPGGDTCQPSAKSIQESTDWLDQFLAQQKDGETHGL